MKELFASASFAGAALTMITFFIGSAVKNKFKSQIFRADTPDQSPARRPVWQEYPRGICPPRLRFVLLFRS